MKAVYIHGFAGSIHSDTITNFRKYYPELDWCPLEVDHRVDESVKKINDFIAAIQEKRAPYVTLDDAASTARVILNIYEPFRA